MHAGSLLACWFRRKCKLRELYSVGLWLLLPILEPRSDFVVWPTSLDNLKKKKKKKHKNLLRFIVSSKRVFQTWHRIVRALKTREANPCPNTREMCMAPENRHLSGLTRGTGLDWWLVEIKRKWESMHVKEGWGKNKIPLSWIHGKTEASQELNCKINSKWIREKYEKSH